MSVVLDELVPPFDDPPDWGDVLRRARRRRLPQRRLVLVAVVLVAALGGGPALGVLLTRDRTPHLPSQADRSNVAVVLQPHTGRVLLEVAPWKGHAGFCYVVRLARAGCVPHPPGSRVTGILSPPLLGWTFDPRVVSGSAVILGRRQRPLTVKHFGGRVDATLFFLRGYGPGFLREVVLRDAAGHVVLRLHWR